MADYMTEAVEAAKGTREYSAGLPFIGTADAVEVYTKAAIRAAAPIIERAVRKRVAIEIENAMPGSLTCRQRGMAYAARIARGTA